MGRRIKHEGDLAMTKANKMAANGDTRGSDSSRKLFYALGVESIVSFMASFHLLNAGRSAQGKPADPSGWLSLHGMFDYLQKETRRDARRHRPMYALVLVLQAVAADEYLKCYSTFENPANHLAKEDFFHHQLVRSRNLPLIREAYEAVDDRNLKADISPWSTVDEVCQAAMRVVRSWCSDEHVDWNPEFNPKEASARLSRGS